jgi:hypothetical protein
VPGTGCNARSMLANRVPKSVPGTGCDAITGRLAPNTVYVVITFDCLKVCVGFGR